MSVDDSPLVIVGAACEAAMETESIGNWRGQVVGCLSETAVSPYRGMTEMLFKEVKSGIAEEIALNRQLDTEDDWIRFRCAGTATQADLAGAAMEQLFDAARGGVDRAHCQLTVYSTSGVSENFFQSTVSSLVARFGLSRSPHFALGELQGASLVAALEVVDGILDRAHAAATAVVVAAEKWPLPFPRMLPFPTVLGDGAAAIGVRRDSACAGLRVLGTLLESRDPFVEPKSGWSHVSERMSAALADVAGRLLDRLEILPSDLSGCIPSGLSRKFDAEIQLRLEARGGFVAAPAVNEGYLGTAAAPTLVGTLLRRLQVGEVESGTTYLLWGASFSGPVSAMVLQAQTPPVHQ